MPIKIHRVSECITKHDQYICCLAETHSEQKIHTGSSEEMEKIFHASGNTHTQKNPGVAILISDKTDFKTKAITRDKKVTT